MRDTSLYAAMWWGDQLAHGSPGHGVGDADAESTMGMLHLLGKALISTPEPTREQISRFEDVLTSYIDRWLDQHPNLELYRDYDTPLMICDAMSEAGISRLWDQRFPCKTRMVVEFDRVLLKDGYGKPLERVYP